MHKGDIAFKCATVDPEPLRVDDNAAQLDGEENTFLKVGGCFRVGGTRTAVFSTQNRTKTYRCIRVSKSICFLLMIGLRFIFLYG